MVTTIEKKRLYKREYARKWRVENPEKDLANQRRFQQKHQVRRRTQKREAYKADPEHYRLYSQNWRKANPEKDFITQQKNRLKKKYSLTLEQFNVMLMNQNSCCAICKTDNPGTRSWHVDHDHQFYK